MYNLRLVSEAARRKRQISRIRLDGRVGSPSLALAVNVGRSFCRTHSRRRRPRLQCGSVTMEA